MKTCLLSLGLLALLPVSAFAISKPTVLWCHGCTESQLTAAVLADATPLGVPIYVGDTATGAVGTYMVYADVDDSKHPPVHVRTVESATADPSIAALMTGALDFYNIAPVGWKKKIADVYTGSDPHASGYTVSNFGADQTNYNVWRNSTWGGTKGLVHVLALVIQLAVITNVADASSAPYVSVTTTFDDGTSVTSAWDYLTTSFKVDPNLSVDSENNPIPYRGADGEVHHAIAVRHFKDDYDGTRDENLLKDGLGRLSIPLQYQPDPGSAPDPAPGGVVPVICVETPGADGSTPEITCYKG